MLIFLPDKRLTNYHISCRNSCEGKPQLGIEIWKYFLILEKTQCRCCVTQQWNANGHPDPPAPLRCRTKVGINWNVTSFGLFKECIVGRTFLSLWEDQTHLLWGNTYSLTILELILSTFSSDLYSINFYLRFVFIYVLLSYNNVSGVCVAGRGIYPDNSNRSLLNSMFKLDEKVNLHPCFCINIVYMVFSRRSDWYAVVLLQH